jgi:hypothetical protein
MAGGPRIVAVGPWTRILPVSTQWLSATVSGSAPKIHNPKLDYRLLAYIKVSAEPDWRSVTCKSSEWTESHASIPSALRKLIEGPGALQMAEDNRFLRGCSRIERFSKTIGSKRRISGCKKVATLVTNEWLIRIEAWPHTRIAIARRACTRSLWGRHLRIEEE